MVEPFSARKSRDCLAMASQATAIENVHNAGPRNHRNTTETPKYPYVFAKYCVRFHYRFVFFRDTGP